MIGEDNHELVSSECLQIFEDKHEHGGIVEININETKMVPSCSNSDSKIRAVD